MKKLVSLFTTSFLVLSSAAFAHSGLSSSIPANNAMLMAAPEQLQLEFNSEVRLVKLYLRNSKAEHIKFNFKASPEKLKKFSYQLPKLTTGNYRVDWMVMGGDAHKMTGYYIFMVHDMNMKMTPKVKPNNASDGHTEHTY